MADIPDREQCAPLPGRGLLSMQIGYTCGQFFVTMLCDCAHETQIQVDTPELHETMEVPLACDGCATVHWMKVTARPDTAV